MTSKEPLNNSRSAVIPAKAGIHFAFLHSSFAGMTIGSGIPQELDLG